MSGVTDPGRILPCPHAGPRTLIHGSASHKLDLPLRFDALTKTLLSDASTETE